jgi:Ca-activated chloride channel homolog
MKRRLLLRPAFAPLAFALLVPVFYCLLNDAGVRAARQSADKATKVTQGALRALDPSGKGVVECPLKHTDVRAEVSGFISRVTVTQEFENPFADKIEAVYVFPLPQAAAVDDMTMTVGGREIKGKIMRREEAQAAYQEAKAQGHVASLLDQERPNIFTQSVANILPGQSVKVTISYVETLKYEAGTYEWSFPMVVGPRYVPAKRGRGEAPAVVQQQGAAGGGRQNSAAPQPTASSSEPTRETTGEEQQDSSGAQPDSARVPDAARISPPHMPKGMRAGHDISIEVTLDAGVPLDSVASATHEIEVERPGPTSAVVRLKDTDAIPNRDFVLRYGVAGQKIEDALLAHHDAQGGYFTLILQPPDRVAAEDVSPKELVFVLDTSGSMDGFPIEKAKKTMKLALDNLYPQDTFNLITFSGDTHILFPEPVPATPENLSTARKFLASRKGDGGTEMMTAIKAALDPSDSSDHVRVVCFMTDGQVGDDFEIISEVQKHPNARVFAMGFGSAPNRFLLDKMAQYGRGEVEYLAEGDNASKAVRRFHERIRNPLLTDISVEWEGLQVSDVYPKLIPDLFSAKPVTIFGRYEHGGRGLIRLKGRAAGREFVREIPVELPADERRHDVLATLWARSRIDDLMGQDMAGMQTGQPSDALREEITRLGLDYRLMTQFTSFVAVEDRITTDGGEPRRVDVPAETPGVPTPPGANANAPQGAVAAAPQSTISVPPGAVVGGVSETVTVAASGAQVNTQSSSSISTVEEHRIADLPLNGRSIYTLTLLAPGSVSSGAPATGDISFNGQRPRTNNFVIDGVSANVGIAPGGQSPGASASGGEPGLTTGGGANGLAPVDATQELTVRAEYVEPEYGSAPGAQLSVVSKSGTNELHGSLFGYLGDDRLDANDWFAKSRGVERQPRSFYDYGGTLGGPFRKNKTFFFASYEGQRQRRPAFAVTEVPALASRLAAPAALRPFLSAFPVPTGAARADGFAEFAAGFSTPARLDSFTFRLDHSAGDRLKLNARYAFASSAADGRGALGSSLNTLSRDRGLAQTLTAGGDYVISSRMVANVRANYSRVAGRGSRLLDAFGGALVPGADTVAGALLSPRDSSFAFDLGGLGAALTPSAEAVNIQHQLDLAGSLELVSGTHSYKLGADYRRLTPFIGPPARERDIYFEGVAAALAGTAARDGSFAHSPARPVFESLSAYAQDEWRRTPRLTLTYGLRWELSPAPHSGRGASLNAITQAEDASRLSLEAAGSKLWRTTFFNFAPRFGLAYQLSNASGRELVLRAGLALFYDTGDAEVGYAFSDSQPFTRGGAAFGVPFDAAAPPAPASALGAPVSAFDPHLRLPYTLRWHATVERGLGRSQSISASYVGAAGRRLLLTRTLLDPSPDFPLARLTTNGAQSDYESAQLQFTRRMARGLQALVSYTWAKSLDDFSEDAPARALLRGDAPGGERGPSDFDVRHTVSGFVSYNLPTPFERGAWRALTRKWTLDALFEGRSARPLNVVYAFPLSYGFALLRPDLLGGVPLYLRDSSAPGGTRLNAAAFALPGEMRQGTLGRNALRASPFYQLDLALGRRFDLNERFRLQLQAEAFNLLNHPNFDDPVATFADAGRAPGASSPLRLNPYFGLPLSARGGETWAGQSAGFGPLYSAGGPRTIQFSLKLTF